MSPPLSCSLIISCRTAVIRWRTAGGELGGGVFGFPSLSFGDGVQEQQGPGWDVGVSGCGTFPPVGPVLRPVGWLNAGGVEELPNEFAAFGPVVIQRLVRPLSRYEDPSPGDAQVFGFVSLALAPPWCHEH